MNYAIQAEGLVKRFADVTALDGVDLAARAGTVLGVLGPNGAGKTTSVRILTTLSNPDGGHATVGGYDIVREPAKVRSVIGLTGQYAGIDEMLTGTENLFLIGRLLGMPKPAAQSRAAELLERFSLTDAAGKSAKQYSGGMRRRLDLAASLVGNPQILFLDEPTTGLDPRARNELWDIVRRLVADGSTVLLTTQYLEEADQLADDIIVIDHGKVIAGGTPAELKAKVGGQSLQIRPSDPGDLDAVAAIVTELAPAAPQLENGSVIVGVPDTALMPAVAGRLDAAGISLDDFHLGLSSLDEVFLTLTGHRAEETEPTPEENK